MAVDDAELLALAGGDSSDEETSQQPTSTANAVSPLPSIEISRADSERFAAGNGKPIARGKTVKKTRKDDSEEDGEASSASSDEHSAPMSESESDEAGDHAPNDDNPYPVDNKFASQQEKREIMSLPELERESFLADRVAAIVQKAQDARLRRMLLSRQKLEAKSSKRKAGSDLEDSTRKSSRQKRTLGGRKVGESSSGIEAYKKQREEKTLKDAERRRGAADRKNRRARSSSEGRYSEADADGESEVEWDDGKAKADDARARTSQPATFDDFRRVVWSRAMLAEHCFWPGFADTFHNCYVRVVGKPNAVTRQANYDLLLVKRVFEKDGREYALERGNGKKVVTKEHFTATVNGEDRDFWFGEVSNSPVTEVEVANHKAAITNIGNAVPTQTALIGKCNEINALINRSWTDAELQEKLKRTGVLANRMEPLDRIAIANRRRAAADQGDETGVAKADAELMALAGPRLHYGTFLVDPRAPPPVPMGLSEQERLAELNKINRKKNTEDVRKAQIAEKRAARLEREAVARGEAVQNPFARVKVLSKTHHDANETLAPHRARQQQMGSNQGSRQGTPSTPLLGPKKDPVARMPTPERKPILKGGIPVLSSRNLDDEVLGAMDLGIDVEI